MKFAQLNYSLWFWGILLLSIFLFWTYKKRIKLLEKFAQKDILFDLISSVSIKRKIFKKILIVLVFVFSILALMRPQMGFEWREIKRRGLDIMIAVDTSKSMLASDVKPNRLERSKFAIKDLIKKLQGDRVGLIAFSGTSFLQCPLTVDYGGFLLALEDLSTNTIPYGGTSVSSAIKKAIDGYEEGAKYKVLIIITDGEDHEGDSIKLAKEAEAKGIKIFCIGIGTKMGELIQITDSNGKKTFLKDREGKIVKSRLDEKVLKGIAKETGGAYIRSSGADFGFDFIYDNKLSFMEKRDIKSQMNKRYNERFQIPLFIAFIFLISEFCISDKRKE